MIESRWEEEVMGRGRWGGVNRCGVLYNQRFREDASSGLVLM